MHIAEIFWIKSRAPLKSEKIFFRIHGEIKIGLDTAARLRKHSFIQMVAK